MPVELETKPTPQAFGSSGGKFHLAKKISAMMPEHKTYVEPYAGGAAVYFYKEPAEKEVLNDMDKEIAFAYRFIRDMTPQQYEVLKRKNWVISREQFGKVKAMKSESDVDRFYKFYYTKKGSFRYGLESVTPSKLGKAISIERLPKVQDRLRGVAINSSDALKMIDKFDSKNTLFYLDPPYPETARIGGNAPEFSKEDLARLVERLKYVRGKFILSMDTANAKTLPKWIKVRKVATKQSNISEGGFLPEQRIEVLATNFKIQKPKRRLQRRHNGHRRSYHSLLVSR
jgi:DNA adenine methylase